jgi:predicted PurR-regulated permease PerM
MPLAQAALIGACAVAILAGLRAASPVVGPVVIALLITIAWSPASRWLQRHGWKPVLAALAGVVVVVVGMALVVLVIWTSLAQLQDKLPEYQARIADLRATIGVQLKRLPFDTSRLFEIEALQPDAVVGYALGLMRQLTSAVAYLGVLGLIVAFLMIESLRYPAKLHDALASLDITSGRLTSFVAGLRRYAGINAVFGLGAAVLNVGFLTAAGVDFAILWGVVSFVLSFLPNIGFMLSLVPPALVALLQFGFGRALVVVVGYIVINAIVDDVIKPRFVGKSLDLSPAVIVLSLLFWGWLLGPVGALLAVPLSMTARFAFESFDELRWLGYLMSDQGETAAAGA